MGQGVSCIMRTREYWGKYTENAIISFLNQDYTGMYQGETGRPKKELIIIDQNERGEEYFNKMGLKGRLDIKYVYQVDEIPENETRQAWRERVGEYRKIGLYMADYEYIMNYDDDDIHLPNRITESVRALESGFDCCYIADVLIEFEGDYYIWSSGSNSYKFESSFIFKKSVFEKMYDIPGWWNMQSLIQGCNVGSISDNLIFVYRIHEKNSVTKMPFIKHLNDKEPITGKLKNTVMVMVNKYYE